MKPEIGKAKWIVLSYRRMLQRSDLTEREAEEIEAVDDALDWLRVQADGEHYVKFITMTLIDGTTEQFAAADACHISRATAQRVQRKFLRYIASTLGYC